jgi:putative polysaccharide biosynthesis protein
MKFPGVNARALNDALSDLFGLRLIRADIWRNYNKMHKQLALDAVRTIEQFNGQKLSSRSKRLADDYAVDVLGGKEFAPWLYVYTLVAGEFREGWIPDNFFGIFVVPNAHKDLGSLTNVKTFTNAVLKTDNLPDLAYYLDGVFYSSDWLPIDLNFVRRSANGNPFVFVKKDGPGRGEGISKISLKDVTEEAFKHIGNCVVQTPIQQHEFFEEIIPGPVATLRLITVRDPQGKIKLRASYLRLGRANTQWIEADNSIRVAVGDDGELDKFGYTYDWRRYTAHPDTNFKFSKHRVPQFEKASEMCIRLHARVPHFAYIGWDVAVDRDNAIKIIEWNADHIAITFSEATTGPCFADLNWERFKN